MLQLTLVFLCALIAGGYGQSSMYQFDPQDVVACALSQGITMELIQGLSFGKPEELYDQLPEARCFLACVLRKMGQFVGEDDAPIIKDLQEKFSSIPNLDFDAAIAECKTKPDELDDGTCMKEYKAFTCFAEKLQLVAKTLQEENLGESAIDGGPEGWEPGMQLEEKTEAEKEEDEEEQENVEEDKKKDEKKGGEKEGRKKDERKGEEKKEDKKEEKKVKKEEKEPKKVVEKEEDDKKKPDLKKEDKKKKTEL